MTNRFARLRRVPKQQGAHVRGAALPGPRSGSNGADPDGAADPLTVAATRAGLPGLPQPRSAPAAATTVLVSAPDDDVRFLLTRRCEMSPQLRVVAESKEQVGSLRAAFRLRPDLIVVQVRSTSETEAELITAFKELSPSSKVFAYSTLPGGAAVSAAMAAGADRYALAGAPLTTLMREIEALAAPGSAGGL